MKKLYFVIFVILYSMIIHPVTAQTTLTQAVDFTVTDIEGNTIHLFNLLDNEGKYVLIDFFFTTCGPCQDAVPKISEAYAYFGCGEYDVEFIAMDYGDTNEECEEFDEQYGVVYPTVSGIEGGGSQVCEDYGINSYPTVILIAPDHSIVEQQIWPIPNAQVVISTLETYNIEENSCSLIADFTSNTNEICDHEYVQFINHSQGDVLSYEWTFEGGYPPTSNQENPAVIYPNSGIFDVELIITNNEDESTVFQENMITVHNCTGTQTRPTKSITISPNPSNGCFQVYSKNKEEFEISVYNSCGSLIHNSINNAYIDISHMSKGFYYVFINAGSSVYKEKLIIQ